MYRIISYSYLILCISISTLEAQELEIAAASWSHSGKCIVRTIPNFIKIIEMTPSDFKTEMKRVGVNVELGENFCYVAAEQFGSEASMSSPAFIFRKCDKSLSVDWYGDQSSVSVFDNLMNDLKDHYLDTRNGMRYYGIEYNGSEYTIRFRRKIEGGTVFEFMTIFKKEK